MFEIVDGRTDGRRTTDDGRQSDWYTISSPMSLRLRWAKKLWQRFVFFLFFFSPQLILQKSSNGQFQRNLSFFKVLEGVQHFPGGVQHFPGEVKLLNTYRNPYNFWFSRGWEGVWTPCPPPPPGSALACVCVVFFCFFFHNWNFQKNLPGIEISVKQFGSIWFHNRPDIYLHPDLGPIYLQRLSAEHTSRQWITTNHKFWAMHKS